MTGRESVVGRPVGVAVDRTANPTDRRVHAVTYNGLEVVRYDRAGKWYAELPGWRQPLTFKNAVHLARGCESVYYGLPGGSRFDAAVRKVRAA